MVLESKKGESTVQTVTEKTFYKQLSGSMAGAIVATSVGGAILGFCAGFCGTQLGWKNILTIVFLVALALCVLLLLWFVVKAFRVKHHRTFKRYGNAALLALKINEGMQNPCYLADDMNPNTPFATLMTDTFIVSGVELVNYMELKDLCTVSVSAFTTTHTIVVGNPVLTVGSMAANYAADKYVESRINENTRFDMVVFTDAKGKKYIYHVHRKDLDYFFGVLGQIAPHIRFVQG